VKSIEEMLDMSPKEANYMPTEYDKLIHQVLFQSAAGKKLIDLWTKELATVPLIRRGEPYTDLKIGLINGEANHKRSMIAICNRINKGGK
jgi:hypothetical protein